MMKTMKYMTMAVLALAGAVTAGCSQDDNIFVDEQQTVNNGNTVTLTATVGFDGGAETRALTEYGVKTFAVGDQIAVIYTDTGHETVKAVSAPLTAADIISGGKSARFSVTVSNPDKSKNVTYIYPACMATDEGKLNYDALKTQDGTLEYIAANLDACMYKGAWDGDDLPTNVTLANQLAICKFTFMSEDADITRSLTSLSIEQEYKGYYFVNPSSLDVIYVAMRSGSTGEIGFYASDGTTSYDKTVTSKTLDAGSIYPIKVSGMSKWDGNLSTLNRDITVAGGMTLTGSIDDEWVISIAAGATVTLKDIYIFNGEDPCITCHDGATIVLSGENTVIGEDTPGIYVDEEETMTIQGDGSLNVQSTNKDAPGIGGSHSYGNIVIAGGTITAQGGKYAAGIGGGYVENNSATGGNITITGGTVTATGGYGGAGIGTGMCKSWQVNGYNKCGNILITGGTVTATGGENAAGIGSGYAMGRPNSHNKAITQCGDITVTIGVTRVTATGGSSYSIGRGSSENGSPRCGTVTVGCTLDSEGNPVGGETYKSGITTNPFTWPSE